MTFTATYPALVETVLSLDPTAAAPRVVARFVDVVTTVPNPAPAAPPAIADRVGTLMGWLKWGALTAIFGAMVFGAGALAVGRVAQNYGAGTLGARSLISGVVGAVLFAAAYPVFQALT